MKKGFDWKYCDCGCKCSELKLMGAHFSAHKRPVSEDYYLCVDFGRSTLGFEIPDRELVNKKVVQVLKEEIEAKREMIRVAEEAIDGAGYGRI